MFKTEKITNGQTHWYSTSILKI